MRLARVITAYRHIDPGIAAVIASQEVDLLQLDYRWPSQWSASGPTPRLGYAPGIGQQLRELHRYLYLDSRLRIVSNAGGDDTRTCVEEIAQFFANQGSPEMLISAVRGDNLLPRLEELFAAGFDMKDNDTGLPLKQLDRPLVAVQVELGAGPLAAALAEGSRVVVAGCYDSAAPFIAAAVSELGCSWDDEDALAAAAVAAHLRKSEFAATPGVNAWQPVIKLDPTGQLHCHLHPQVSLDPPQLQERLRRSLPSNHADVCYDVSALRIERGPGQSIAISGVTGRAPSDAWRIRITYDAGYEAQVVVGWHGGDRPDRAAERDPARSNR